MSSALYMSAYLIVCESLIHELCSVYECLFKLYMSVYLSVCESYS